MTTPKKIIGWRPKGEEQAKFIGHYYLASDGSVLPGSIVYFERLGILEALCDPIEETEPEKWEVFDTEEGMKIGNLSTDYWFKFRDKVFQRPLPERMKILQAICDKLNSSPKGPVTLGSLGKELVKSWMLCAHQHGREATESFEVWYKRSEEGIVNSQIKWPVTLTDEEIRNEWFSYERKDIMKSITALVRWARGEDKPGNVSPDLQKFAELERKQQQQ